MSRARPGGRPPSQRQLRVGEAVRHALVEILARGELRDPVLVGTPITVSEVRISPDLKNATAFVSPLGGAAVGGVDPQDMVQALRRASSFLRGQLAREIELRYVPALSFEVDRSFDEAAQIDAILRSPRVRQDLDHEDGADDGGDPEDKDGFDGDDSGRGGER